MRATAILLLLVLHVLACSRRSDSQPAAATTVPSQSVPAEVAFWRWFVAHKDEAATIRRADEPIANELGRELARVDPGLTFEVGANATDHELVVSADGIKSVFPSVKRVVAAAPAIPGWKITAFRPRGSTQLSVEIDGHRLAGDELMFRVLGTTSNTVDVALYVKGVQTVGAPLKQAVYLLLDTTLGEYDVESYLGDIDIEPGAAAPVDARPLTELPIVVDALK
jgi:hypothetical protein